MVTINKVIYIFKDGSRRVDSLVNASVSSRDKLAILRTALREAMGAKYVRFEYEER
jgi:hypothetical protein